MSSAPVDKADQAARGDAELKAEVESNRILHVCGCVVTAVCCVAGGLLACGAFFCATAPISIAVMLILGSVVAQLPFILGAIVSHVKSMAELKKKAVLQANSDENELRKSKNKQLALLVVSCAIMLIAAALSGALAFIAFKCVANSAVRICAIVGSVLCASLPMFCHGIYLNVKTAL